MTPKYANETSVPVAKTKMEIEALLEKYGATGFISGWDQDRAVIGFLIEERQVKITLPMINIRDYSRDSLGRARGAKSAQAAYDQATRSRWRGLLLVIKAKLEAVSCGISTVEREFLSDVVLPNGETFHEWAKPQIKMLYAENRMPKLITG